MDIRPMGNPVQEIISRAISIQQLPTQTGLCRLVAHDPRPGACRTQARDTRCISDTFLTVATELVDGKRPWPPYLHGPVGSGKTSAALWLLDRYGPPPCSCRVDSIIHDWYSGFIRARHMTALIQADEGRFGAYRDGESWRVTEASLERTFQKAPLIVLDDLAVGERPSDWHIDRLLEILDWRCGHHAKPLIVTGNLPPSELLKTEWGRGRLADRLLRGTRFKMAGASKRTGIAA
jgi:hypothetical protein